MQFFRQHIESMLEIDDEEWATIASFFTKVTYTKGIEVCSAGEIFTKLYYVADGALCVYSISSEGKEITFRLSVCYGTGHHPSEFESHQKQLITLLIFSSYFLAIVLT